jgi:2-keto-4-pentenoate hydratase
MSLHDIPALAVRQLQDYRNANPGTCFADPEFSIDINTAYHLQNAVTKLRVEDGENVIGYKVGCIGPTTTAQFGMDGPIRGTLFGEEVLKTGASIDINSFRQLAVEGEMAIRIGSDGDIESAFPVIELHNFIFRAEKQTLPELVGNNGINAGAVFPQLKWQQSKELLSRNTSLAIKINGIELGTGNLWPKSDGTKASVDWLRKHLKKFKIPLLPGQIVLTGTNLGLYTVQNGDHVTVFVDDQPTVACSIGPL